MEESDRTVESSAISAGWGPGARFRTNRKKRMARRRRWTVSISPLGLMPRLPEDITSLATGEMEENGLRFLLQKELQNSDVGSLGRMVLPKKGAEAHLPNLTTKEGIFITMEDMETLQVWKFKYRFWPNNKSRMYVLENTGEFVKAHNLQLGDIVMFYRDDQKQKYFIRAKKASDHKTPVASTVNSFFNAKTVEDHLVPEIEVSNSSYFHVNLPVADEMMRMAYVLNDPFTAEFPMYFSSEMMGNAPKLESIPSFESVDNLSLDDFE